MRKDRLEQWDKGQVDKNKAIFSVVDDVHQLLGKQARINGVQHRTVSGDSVVQLEMTVVIPGQGSNALTVLNVEFFKQIGYFTSSGSSVFHCVAMNITFTATTHDFRVRVG